MSELTLRLFGPFEARLGDDSLSHFRTTKVQALLIYLAVEPPIVHTREHLMELLWPGLPVDSARTNLRQIIYQLRKQIPEVNGVELILSERATVQRSPEAAVVVDATDFASLIAQVRRHDHTDVLTCANCRDWLEQTVALYRDTFLNDFFLDDSNEFEDWARTHREAYRRQMMDTLGTLAEMNLRLGEYRQAQTYARRQLAMDDLDERAYRHLMEALARNGRRQEALTAFDQIRRVLWDELGMAPSRQTADLAELIRADNLEVAAPRPAAVRGYRLLDEIGAGALGVVHRAYQPVVGREVAIKVIRPRFANNPDFIRRFEMEAQTVARLEHPHIVPLYDYWREPDNAYLVMRWLRGGSLADRLTGEPLPLDTIAVVVDQIAAALQAAHRQHIIHHDVKAANILLDEEGNAYLSDFSVARDLLTDEVPLDLSSSPETISPEQLLKEGVSPMTDQYSLGVTIYHMLTGHAPLPSDLPLSELSRYILTEPFPLVAEQVPGLSLVIDDVLRRATAKQPGDRFPDMISMARAFQRAIGMGSPAAARSAEQSVIESEATFIANPYKGLRAFEESDAATFFGREALVARLARRLDSAVGGGNRFLAVVGPSGSGKSSVVKAGLLPALRTGALAGSENWFITEMTPGQQPLEELATALLRVAVDPPAELLDPLEHDDRGLVHVLERILPAEVDGQTPQLLLVIDQLEELYTLTDVEETRRQFIDRLLAALEEPDSRLRIVTTLRADFYDRPLQTAGLGELVRQNTEVVLPLSPAELEAAVTQPALQAGVGLERGLLTAITADVTDQPGTLPLMQYALTELFEQRSGRTLTNETYRAIGGVSGALGRRADEIYDSLNENGQAAARQMFLRLVTLGEGVEDTRRRALRTELEALEVPGTDMGQVIDTFGQYRLLSFDRDPVTRGPTVEVAHEALLREWELLRGWLDESRADVRMQRLLAAEAAAWQAAGEDDSYLLRGSRLEQYDGWVETAGVLLTNAEQAYLTASLAARDLFRAEEEARRRRELETARQLAETERRRAEEQLSSTTELRRRAMLLAGLFGVAAILALAAVSFARSSNENAGVAATRAAEANANAMLAVENASLASTRQAEAVANAGIAATRESQAAAEADFRATAEAEAAEQRDVALASEREALEAYSLSLAANARQALDANDQPLALLLALAANTIDDPPLEAWRTLLDVAYAPGTSRTVDAGSPILAVDISPSGQAILTGSEDGHVRLWDVRSGAILLDMAGHTDAVTAVAVSPNGRQALSGSVDKSVVLWDINSGERIRTFTGHGNGVSTVSFVAGGLQALSGEDSGTLPGEMIVWDLATGEAIEKFGGDQAELVEGVLSLATNPDASLAVAGYARRLPSQDEDSVGVWDTRTGELVRYLQGTERAVNSVAISPNGKMVLGAADDATVYVWDLETGALEQRLAGHGGIASAVAISPDGTTALSGAFNGDMIWWDLRTGETIDRFSGHSKTVTGIRFLDDNHAISVSTDESIRLWDLTGQWQHTRWGQPDAVAYCTADFQGGFRKVSSRLGQPVADQGTCVTELEISLDGRYALSGSIESTGENVLTLRDYETGQVIHRMTGIEAPVREIEFTPDSTRALTGHDDQTILVWDLQIGEVIGRLQGHNGAVTGIDISDDGRYAVSASLDAQVGYWDLITGRLVRRMMGYSRARGATDVQFLPGEQLAISAGWDGTLTIWDLSNGEQVRRLTGLDSLVGSHFQDADFDTVTFEVHPSPDGRYALSAGDDESVLLWDLGSGQSIRRFTGHGDNVTSVRFTPNGQWALSSARNDMLFLWDVHTGQLVRQFSTRRSSDGGFTPAVAIHPDGTSFLTDDADGTILKWRLVEPAPTELIEWLTSNRTLRELTCLERETFRIEPLCEDGLPITSTAEMLAVARRKTAALNDALQPAAAPLAVTILDEAAPERFPKVAQIGDNRGELSRHGFDVWTYVGKADEVLSIQMIADHPLTDQTLPVEKRYESGVLDTVLYVLRPDGSLLSRTDDDVTPDGTRLSDANILALSLPEDGAYRIEARSALDDHAGGYTLRIKPLERVWNEELFKQYEGLYLDGPWEYHLFVFLQGERLYDYVQEGGYVEEYFPISETEFVLTDGILQRFTLDETGKVDGYDVYISLIHPVGGRWYRGTRIGDLPDNFYETLENVLSQAGGQ